MLKIFCLFLGELTAQQPHNIVIGEKTKNGSLVANTASSEDANSQLTQLPQVDTCLLLYQDPIRIRKFPDSHHNKQVPLLLEGHTKYRVPVGIMDFFAKAKVINLVLDYIKINEKLLLQTKLQIPGLVAMPLQTQMRGWCGEGVREYVRQGGK